MTFILCFIYSNHILDIFPHYCHTKYTEQQELSPENIYILLIYCQSTIVLMNIHTVAQE